MLEELWGKLYDKITLSYYKNLFREPESGYTSLSSLEGSCLEVIYLLGKPTVSQFASFCRMSLDVYKRQAISWSGRCWWCSCPICAGFNQTEKSTRFLLEAGAFFAIIRGDSAKEGNAVLQREKLVSALKGDFFKGNLVLLEEAASTNLTLKELAAKGAPEGTAVFCERQSAGRGRLGRSFHSPAGEGIYLSVLLRPRGELTQAAAPVSYTHLDVYKRQE